MTPTMWASSTAIKESETNFSSSLNLKKIYWKIRFSEFAKNLHRYYLLMLTSLTSPGVSTNTIWVSSSVKATWRFSLVVSVLWDTPQTLYPANELTKVLFPAFGIPMNATFIIFLQGAVSGSQIGNADGIPFFEVQNVRVKRALVRIDGDLRSSMISKKKKNERLKWLLL